MSLSVVAPSAWALDDRSPVPTAQEQTAAVAQIKDVYTDDLAKPQPADKAALARTMLNQEETIRNDLGGKYELLMYARQLAAQGGDAGTALEAADRLGKEFQVRPGEARAAVVEYLLASVVGSAAAQEAADALIGAADVAQKDDDYDSALTLSKAAETLSRKSGSFPTISSASQKVKWIASLKSEADKIRPALIILDKDPSNATANLTVGRFYCFVKNDWDKGLGYLSLGSDAKLKDAAMRDMASASGNAGDKLGAADTWYTIGATVEGNGKVFVQMRAFNIYSDILKDLTGLERSKAEHRIAELQHTADSLTDHSKTWTAIRKDLAGGTIKKWDFIGGAFSHIEEDDIPRAGAFLVGFNYTTKEAGAYPDFIQAIWRTPTGDILGKAYGTMRGARNVSRLTQTRAKPGYAVGAIFVRGGGGFDAFQPIFMRIGPDGLRPDDHYEGPYIGGKGGGSGIVGDANFIVGLHIKVGKWDDVIGFSIVTATFNKQAVRIERRN